MVSPNSADGTYSKGTGTLFTWDGQNHRIVAFSKNGGKYVAQYVAVSGGVTWSDLQDFEIPPSLGTDVPNTMWWVSSNAFYTSTLVDAQPTPAPSPSISPSPAPSGSAKPGKSPKPSTKPSTKPGASATPRPSATPKPS